VIPLVLPSIDPQQLRLVDRCAPQIDTHAAPLLASVELGGVCGCIDNHAAALEARLVDTAMGRVTSSSRRVDFGDREANFDPPNFCSGLVSQCSPGTLRVKDCIRNRISTCKARRTV
jgi:hypothetical protein